MADIKTITQTIASGSYDIEERYLKNDEIPDVWTVKLLKEKIVEKIKLIRENESAREKVKEKIDELVEEVNKLKNS